VTTQHLRKGRFVIGGLSGLVVAVLGALAAVLWLPPGPASEHQSEPTSSGGQTSHLQWDGTKVIVPGEVIRALSIQTESVSKPKPRALPAMAGCTALDSNALARVTPRFPGEIVSIGKYQSKSDDGREMPGADRPLRYGDRVEKGQLLAVLWSKDLGEKKSEFVDAICRFKLDNEQLNQLEKLLHNDGAVSEQSVRDARSKVQADLIAVRKAERTLRAWRLTDGDIETLKTEAQKLEARPTEDRNEFERWARVEITAPQDGVIMEMNVGAVGGLVSDTSADLFKIAETKKMTVWAYVYEDDLPMLTSLLKKKNGRLPWTVRLPSHGKEKGYSGFLERIGEMIDPVQHTALVMGIVDNTNLELKVGQYVTIQIEQPADDDEVEIRTTALVEDGGKSVVFVQPVADEAAFQPREVTVSRRYHDKVYVRDLSLQVGEQVIVSGALLLYDAVRDKIAAPVVASH